MSIDATQASLGTRYFDEGIQCRRGPTPGSGQRVQHWLIGGPWWCLWRTQLAGFPSTGKSRSREPAPVRWAPETRESTQKTKRSKACCSGIQCSALGWTRVRELELRKRDARTVQTEGRIRRVVICLRPQQAPPPSCPQPHAIQTHVLLRTAHARLHKMACGSGGAAWVRALGTTVSPWGPLQKCSLCRVSTPRNRGTSARSSPITHHVAKRARMPRLLFVVPPIRTVRNILKCPIRRVVSWYVRWYSVN